MKNLIDISWIALNKRSGWFVLVAVTILIGLYRSIVPELPVDYTGPFALLEAIFSLGLLGVIISFSRILGNIVLRGLIPGKFSILEEVVLSLPIGMGIIAYVVFFLGLIGLLQPGALYILLLVGLLGIYSRSKRTVLWISPSLSQVIAVWKGLSTIYKASVIVCLFILLATFFQALTPVWDYDGLMYHLNGARLFLQSKRIILLPDIWQANGPNTLDMLFLFGLGLGSETFAKLVHVTFAVLLVLAVFTFGKMYLSDRGGWIAAGILLGIPIFPIWASWAYTDMAWALYEFLSFCMVFYWIKSQRRRWLILAGIFSGFALGSKYLAIGTVFILGLWILMGSRSLGWRGLVINSSIYLGVATCIGIPWYLKNLVLAGNPIYPFIIGGPGWDKDRLEILMQFLGSFGTGRSLLDYVLIPLNLFVQRLKFGAFLRSIEIPSPLFLLTLVYPFTQKSREMGGVIIFAVMRVALWAFGSQQTRFLLPIFPVLCLITSHVLITFPRRHPFPKIGHILSAGLIGGMIVATLFYSIIHFMSVNPLDYIIGRESKDDFLHRMVYDYPALKFIQTHIPSNERVLMMWDGQGYYCDERCIPDAEQSLWTQLYLKNPEVPALVNELRSKRITHLMFTVNDAEFILEHDPSGDHRRALSFFLNEFQSTCLEEIYQDKVAQIYKLTCL